jgi:hypothetical protein
MRLIVRVWIQFLDDEESIDPAVEAIEKQWGAPPLVSKE